MSEENKRSGGCPSELETAMARLQIIKPAVDETEEGKG
jgi:hypothetical protein